MSTYRRLALPFFLFLALAVAGCASDDSRSAGRETGSAGKEVVQGVKEAGKEVGHGVKDASKQAWEDIKEFGRGVKEGWNSSGVEE